MVLRRPIVSFDFAPPLSRFRSPIIFSSSLLLFFLSQTDLQISLSNASALLVVLVDESSSRGVGDEDEDEDEEDDVDDDFLGEEEFFLSFLSPVFDEADSFLSLLCDLDFSELEDLGELEEICEEVFSRSVSSRSISRTISAGYKKVTPSPSPSSPSTILERSVCKRERISAKSYGGFRALCLLLLDADDDDDDDFFSIFSFSSLSLKYAFISISLDCDDDESCSFSFFTMLVLLLLLLLFPLAALTIRTRLTR